MRQKPQEAIELLKLNVEAYPNSVLAVNNLGNAYRDLKQREPAIQCFEKSLKLLPIATGMSAQERTQSAENLRKKIEQLRKRR